MHADLTAQNASMSQPLQPKLPVHDARMHALLEAAVDGIISIDDRAIIQTINSAAERLFGYHADELIGKNLKMLMPTPYQSEHDAHIARYLATGVKRVIGIGREVVGLKSDGSTFPMELSVAEARVEGQRIFLGIIRDITDRKRAEEAHRASNQSLEKALAELQAKSDEIRTMTQQLWQAAKLASVGELAAGIAHEINNPLATVSLRIESVLARTPTDDPRRRALEIIEQEVKRMTDLVANLLQFSRRGRDEASTVDLPQELGKAVELIHHHLRKHLINVVQELDPNTPTIYADRQKLRQVFLNLLTNAADAMPEGGDLDAANQDRRFRRADGPHRFLGYRRGHFPRAPRQGHGPFLHHERGRTRDRVGPGDMPAHCAGTPGHPRDRQRSGQGHHGTRRAARQERHQCERTPRHRQGVDHGCLA